MGTISIESHVSYLQLIAKIPTIVVKLEGGVGKRTVPLLIVESAFEGEVRDWSTKVDSLSSFSLHNCSKICL